MSSQRSLFEEGRRIREGEEGATSCGVYEALEAKKGRGAESPLKPPGGTQPYLHLDFTLLISRTVGEYICVGPSHQIMLIFIAAIENS